MSEPWLLGMVGLVPEVEFTAFLDEEQNLVTEEEAKIVIKGKADATKIHEWSFKDEKVERTNSQGVRETTRQFNGANNAILNTPINDGGFLTPAPYSAPLEFNLFRNVAPPPR